MKQVFIGRTNLFVFYVSSHPLSQDNERGAPQQTQSVKKRW